jgi:acyl-CoA reductase-like NAD-dependent aldehyde dehydrogenase
MLIGGDWVSTPQVRTIDLPYDGTPVAEVYEADATIVDRAVARGARLLTGSTRLGAIIEPAVLTDVPPDDDVCCKEVFGPLVVLHHYSRREDPFEGVNASEYGLRAGICTRDIGKAFDTARKLRVGGAMVNDVPAFRVDLMPYGGTKMSGVCHEGPRYAAEEMAELKLICWRG